ncbi:T9SS type A sorting domain-containing protein [Flavobacterium sp. LHD-85]|uniref:T9SS type A sorting domain-containing protein n=1 Tax=Flavobacterium sp. LHD-85 TaxID=3071410 RepID=UPI0027E112A7|nr:T9SS type A sorting domain-containing protein [Flavobacterium sp. LHD-85]MDQ6530221.1 T9SS type A sorting domain-containing protein [Flavobacterium sp. LHD-85]
MKKIYLLVVLLFSGFGFAQVNLTGNATYALKISGEVGADGSSCGNNVTRGLQWIASNDINNNPKTIVQGTASYPNNGHGLTAQTFDPAIVYFTDTDKIKELFIGTTKRDRGTTGCKDVQYSTATIPVTTDNFSQNFVFSDLALNQSGNVQVDVYPIINLVNPNTLNNIIGTESSINVPAISGIKNEYFNWMYHIEGEQDRIRFGFGWRMVDKWRSLPAAYQGRNELNILCKDFLPYEAVGKKIWLRANTNGSTVELLYVKSAPHILSVEPIQTSCFDTNDGKVKINFSRPLDDGEILSLDFDGVNGTDVPNITKDGVLDGKKLEADNSYTVKNLNKGLTTLKLLGYFQQGAFKANTYVMDPQHQTSFTITSPAPVDFSLDKRDINCHGGSDGEIYITATGGIDNGIYQYSKDGGVTWVSFLNSDKTTISNLGLGEYFIKVRKIIDVDDEIGCIAKTPQDKDKVLSKLIEQPLSPLALSSKVLLSDPTFYKAEDGKVIVSVKGGSPIDGNSYSYEWRNEKNEKIASEKSEGEFFDGIFTITLQKVPEGTYTLTVTDKFNCVLTPKPVGILDDPDPIEIKLKIRQNIFCNSANLGEKGLEDETLAANGSLVALVKGGKVLEGSANKGLPYYFYWKKQVSKDVWEDLEINDSIAVDLPQGTYSVNVKDANEIMHGTYTITEQTPVDVEQTLIEPDELKVEITFGGVSCFDGTNGWAKASIKDAKSTYKYTWYGPDHNGVLGEEITKLKVGTYYVNVVDTKKGCFVRDSIVIKGPDEEVKINYSTISTPTFSGASNGKIVAQITGGTAFDPAKNNGRLYDYEWTNKAGDIQNPTAEIVNGIYTITLDNVPADIYSLTITDKNFNEAAGQVVNCSVLKSEIKLTEPDPLKVVFEVVKTISCNAKNEYGNKADANPNDGQRDESQDGVLKAHVTGGTPLELQTNKGLPYFFYWKKQEDGGTWKDLEIQNPTISNLSYGNYALNVEDRNGVILGTYTAGKWVAKDSIQFMDQPPVLSVKIDKGDVFCNGGNDGWATATAEGGSGDYKYVWSNEVESDKNTILKTGTYWVIATDKKGCTAYAEVFIDEPKKPLAINYKEVFNPTFYKATNGKIVVEVTGGTIFKDNTYWFEWKNSKGVVQTATTTSFANDIYTIFLEGLGEETYTLTVRDANYNLATNKASCTVANVVTELEDPDPLEVTFEVIRGVSCNVSNEFGNEIDANPQDSQRDESQDAILKAHVTGGIQLPAEKNNRLPYFYTWKKKQKDGSWTLWNNTGDTAEYLSEGTYALNIEDANGIKLGTYVNNVLVKEIDAEKYIPQPDQLKLSFTKFDVGCTTGDDGWAEAHVTGGTPPYTYEWTNGETTPKIENITTNNYFVIVTDDNGCVVQGSIFVGDPNGILTTETVKNPTCFQGNDGSIELNVTGGNLPYSYLWNTGAVTKDLNNLTAGNYEVTITCPDCCVYKKRFVLKDPEPVIVNVGKDRTLCIDQSLDLDATIKDPLAKYNWTSTNGFTSNEAKINVSKAGTYHVKVTTALGCIGEDDVVIKTSQMAISAEFLLSSQAYLDEEVILVNTSNPFGESTDWVVPNGVKVVEQKEKYITLKFDAIGVYSIGLKQTQGECYAVYTKNITVEQRSTMPSTETASQFIIDFIVTPNPSNGNFKAIVNLENISGINLRLFSSSGQNTMIQKQESGKKKYEVDFNTSLQSGVYIIVLETGQQTLVKKIIIN